MKYLLALFLLVVSVPLVMATDVLPVPACDARTLPLPSGCPCDVGCTCGCDVTGVCACGTAEADPFAKKNVAPARKAAPKQKKGAIRGAIRTSAPAPVYRLAMRPVLSPMPMRMGGFGGNCGVGG